MNRNDDPRRRSGNERTRSTDTVATITAELVAELAEFKTELTAMIADDAEHATKHALLNRVAALQGALDLLDVKFRTCDHVDQCPLKDILGRFATPDPRVNQTVIVNQTATEGEASG